MLAGDVLADMVVACIVPARADLKPLLTSNMMLHADAVSGHMHIALGLHRAAGTRGPANNRVHTAHCHYGLHGALGLTVVRYMTL